MSIAEMRKRATSPSPHFCGISSMITSFAMRDRDPLKELTILPDVAPVS